MMSGHALSCLGFYSLPKREGWGGSPTRPMEPIPLVLPDLLSALLLLSIASPADGPALN